MKVRKAIIPAAGLGTRFLPATKAQPKEMLPIVDKPAIQFIVEEAIQSGIEDIIIVTGRNKRSIEDHFDRSIELEMELKRTGKEDLLNLIQDISNLVDIHYIRQKEPRGLGQAIYCARSFIGDEPFAVLLGDDIVVSEMPCLKQLINVYNEYRTTVIGVQEVPRRDVNKYGILECKPVEDRIFKIRDLVEKPEPENAPSNVAILGRYIITPRIFEYLGRIQPGALGEIQLTDALRELCRREAMYAYNFTGKRYDLGNKIGFLQATVEHALQRDDIRDEFMAYLRSLLCEAGQKENKRGE